MKRFTIFLGIVFMQLGLYAQIQTQIVSSDSEHCIGGLSEYTIKIDSLSNKYFDKTLGIDGYISTGAHGIKDVFTMELLVKPNRTIIMQSESTVCPNSFSVPLFNSNQNWAIFPQWGNSGFIGVGLTIGTNGIMIAEHHIDILVSRLSYATTINDWAHIAITYTDNKIRLFIDGVMVREKDNPCSQVKYTSSDIARAYQSPEFNGQIDEIRYWDIALSEAQVNQVAYKKIVNEIPNLRYYASFDDGSTKRNLGDLGVEYMVIKGEIDTTLQILSNSMVSNFVEGVDVDNLSPLSNNYTYEWFNNETSQSINYASNQEVDTLWAITTNGSFVDTASLIINVNPVYYEHETESICQGESMIWEGNTYNTSGIYTANYTTINGCDSIRELTLTVNPTYFLTKKDSICVGESYSWQGSSYNTTGVYYANYTSITGCDSIYELNLTVNPTYYFTKKDSICEGESYSWQGNSYNTTGVYNANYSSISGCDSIYELDLSVNILPSSFTITGSSDVTENEIEIYSVPENSGVTYSWYAVKGNVVSYPSDNSSQVQWGTEGKGNLKAISTNQFGCESDTARLEVNIGSTGIGDEAGNNRVRIYPNPFNDRTIIEFPNPQKEKYTLRVVDLSGKVVRLVQNITDSRVELEKGDLPSGIYFIELRGTDNFRKKVMIE